MGKDMKRARGGAGASLATGLLIGVVAGVAAAVGVALYLNRGASPFTDRVAGDKPAGKLDASQPAVLRPAGSDKEEPSFDFYKVLPELSGSNGDKTAESGTKATASAPVAAPTPEPEKAAQQQVTPAPEAAAPAMKTAFLQVGSFQNEQDADNLKARLALTGMMASIQTAEVPGKGLWHRVRVGPYTNLGELERARDTLKASGMDATVVRAQ
ncbi:SPOR domain-containing protein [Chitinibacteraceae bacterium HSL-7]